MEESDKAGAQQCPKHDGNAECDPTRPPYAEYVRRFLGGDHVGPTLDGGFVVNNRFPTANTFGDATKLVR